MKHALLGVLAACSSSSPPNQACERGATLELRVVDEDAAFSKQLFAHVGSELRDGTPTDPAAIAAGIRAEVDMWREDPVTTGDDRIPYNEGKRHVDYYLVASDRAALERYIAALGPVPSDREIGYEHARDGRWRTYYVMKSPLLDTTAIGRVEVGHNDIMNMPIVVVSLTDDGRRVFAAGTKSIVGKKLANIVDGTILSAPIIMSAITGGRLSITMPSKAAADALAAKLACVTK